MKCLGDFVFKGIEERQGGEFQNSQGQMIKYESSYVIKVDEITDNGIYERKLKVPKTNVSLINKLKQKKPYDDITLLCDIVLYGSQARVIPIDLQAKDNK